MPKLLRKCPICAKPTNPKAEVYPFCSDRCQVQDLANWSTESYIVSRPLTEADENLGPQVAAEEDSDYQ